MAALAKPTLGVNTDYAARIGLLFDAFNNGNYQFPATQVPSADANTLDDYEEGTFTPAITFATPGNLSVGYSTALGAYTKIGRMVMIALAVVTSGFTHTTASGDLSITGLPFTTPATTNLFWGNGLSLWQGITRASYTFIGWRLAASTTTLSLIAAGSAQTAVIVGASDMPTGGSVALQGSFVYHV